MWSWLIPRAMSSVWRDGTDWTVVGVGLAAGGGSVESSTVSGVSVLVVFVDGFRFSGPVGRSTECCVGT